MTDTKYAQIEEVANGYVVTIPGDQFVFTSLNTALKKVREVMATDQTVTE